MAWRLHLTDGAIYRLNILHGNPDVLSVWLTDDQVAFFNLETGASLGKKTINPPVPAIPSNPSWQIFTATLQAPNAARLPLIRLPALTLHRTINGQHTLQDGANGPQWQTPNGLRPLGGLDRFTVIQMDGVAGTVVALDEQGYFHLYQQGEHITSADIGLQPDDTIPEIAISDGGKRIVVTDGNRLAVLDSGGNLRARKTMLYPVGRLACAPDGHICLTTDAITGILRAYRTTDLTFTHQKFAVDLYAAATPIQLLAGVATPRTAVSALSLGNNNRLAFALGGFITVSSLAHMQKLPTTASV